jgi:hypothetical protein
VVNPISERSGLLSIIKGVSARPTQGSHRYVICRRRRIITQNEYRPFLPPRVGTCMALLRERFFFAFASTPQSFVSGPSQTRDGESPTNPWPACCVPPPVGDFHKGALKSAFFLPFKSPRKNGPGGWRSDEPERREETQIRGCPHGSAPTRLRLKRLTNGKRTVAGSEQIRQGHAFRPKLGSAV